MLDVTTHFQNLYSVFTAKGIRPSRKIAAALITCKSDNIGVLFSLEHVREFLTVKPWTDLSTLCKMCCILPTQIGELLTHLNMHIVVVCGNLTLVLPIDDLISGVLSKIRFEFSSRFLKSLQDGYRHFYFGYLRIERTVIRVMWGSCGQFCEVPPSGMSDDFRSWMSICILHDDDTKRFLKIREWLSDFLAHSMMYCKFRIAVYNKNTCAIADDAFTFQGLLKCNFLACDSEYLDPFTLYMKQTILYIASTMPNKCFSKCECGELCQTIERLCVDIYKTFDNKTLNPIMFNYVERLQKCVEQSGFLRV